MQNRAIPFRPKLEGDFRIRFYEKASQITKNTPTEIIEDIVANELDWVENKCTVNISQRKKYRAVWLLFRDLVRASWQVGFSDGILEMHMPILNKNEVRDMSLTEKKMVLRKWMLESRNDRLLDYADFVSRMETPTLAQKDIRYLIADGSELYGRLELVLQDKKDITESVKPYLQLVTENERDKLTNLKLSDIWRYFRLTWSTPYETTPGRTMQYLIRDAAHPYHAVMGIASLENCAVQITCRDERIGWTPSAFKKDLLGRNDVDYAKKRFEDLLSHIQVGIDGIDTSDLCKEDDIENPSDNIVQRLINLASIAEDERQHILKQAHDGTLEDGEKSELGSISKEAEAALYTRKRAEQLAKLLNAKRQINALLNDNSFSINYKPFLEDEGGITAVRTAIIAQKTMHVGSSMMELNICGAVPPYNELLAGKLVALLALSPQVISDYRSRYKNKQSEIASRLKNQPVCRAADLVYIGTTSLYYVGSSQYNRLKIPSEITGTDYSVRWDEIGNTIGYGTLHISKPTTMSLAEATSGERGFTNINHVFGEGASPKMRLLSMAVRDLLETSPEDIKDFTKHAMARIVYGAELATNTKQYLLGLESAPKYYYQGNSAKKKTKEIVEFWQKRWLGSRINYTPALERVKHFEPEKFLLSKLTLEARTWKYKSIKEDKNMTTPNGNSAGLDYIREFYRGSSAYADMINPEILKRIHVPTKLDNAIIEAVKSGKDVILTGNPGDGKTHLIRILNEKLLTLPKTPVVDLDASCKTSEELYNEWKNCRESKKPFVIAINAAVLYGLNEQYGDVFSPVQSALSQMLGAIKYNENKSTIAEDDVVVYDLSKRNVLADSIVANVIDKITDPSSYPECGNCQFKNTCDLSKNARLMQSNLFKKRLGKIFKRVALKGYHATLREVQAFVSYVFLGDRSCTELIKTASANKYDITNLVYSGKGMLFDAIRDAFDPAGVSHPILDEKILQMDIPADKWVTGLVVSSEAIDPNRDEVFRLRKRQLYFFHELGKQLIAINSDDVTMFEELLESDNKTIAKDAVQKLNAFFGLFKAGTDFKIWTGHRYNVSPRKILLSTGKIKRSHFAVGRPLLIDNMATGIDFVPDYITIHLKDHASISLKIDFDTYCLLLEAERGVPMLFVENNTAKKIWRFIEQLQECVAYDDEDEPTISVFDVQNKKEVMVTVDLVEKSYTSIINVKRASN